MIHRRDFITLLGGAAAWPLAAGAQQGNRMRHLALLSISELDQGPSSAMWEELKRRGWSEGRNLRPALRYGANNANRLSAYAAELVSLSPDVLVAIGGGAIRALQKRTQTIPIVAIGDKAGVREPARTAGVARGNVAGLSVVDCAVAREQSVIRAALTTVDVHGEKIA